MQITTAALDAIRVGFKSDYMRGLGQVISSIPARVAMIETYNSAFIKARTGN